MHLQTQFGNKFAKQITQQQTTTNSNNNNDQAENYTIYAIYELQQLQAGAAPALCCGISRLPPSFVFFFSFFLRRKTISIAAAPLPLSKDMPYFRLHNKFANHVLSSSSWSSLGLGHCMPHRHQRRQRQRRAWHQVPVVAIASISAPPPSPACLAFLCSALLCGVCVLQGAPCHSTEKIRQQPQQALPCLPACLFGRFINFNLANRLSPLKCRLHLRDCLTSPPSPSSLSLATVLTSLRPP